MFKWFSTIFSLGAPEIYTQRQWRCCQPMRKACPLSLTNQEQLEELIEYSRSNESMQLAEKYNCDLVL